MWKLERTKDSHQNMTFDPITDGTQVAASPNTKDMFQVQVSSFKFQVYLSFFHNTHYKYDMNIKERTEYGDCTKTHLHTKFERNPSRNVAVRAHKRHIHL